MSTIDSIIIATKVDAGTVFSVVGGVSQLLGGCVSHTLTDGTHLSAAKNLEGIAGLEVDGGAAPDLRVLTIATTKDIEGLAQHIHTLFVENHTRMALLDGIAAVAIEQSLTFFLFYLVEDGLVALAVYQRRVEIDNHITIHMTTLVATAIDIATGKTTVQVGSTERTIFRDRVYVLTIGVDSVPYQLLLGVAFPALGLYLQT